MARKTAKPKAPPKPKRLTTPQLRESLGRRKLELESQLYESAAAALNYVNPLEPYVEDGQFWIPLGYNNPLPMNTPNRGRGERLPLYRSEYELRILRDQSRFLCEWNPYAINALDNRAAYIVGEGLVYNVVENPKNPATPEKIADVQNVIDEFLDANDFDELESEIVNRCDKDGEAFLRLHDEGGDDPVQARVIEPEQVKAPAGSQDSKRYSYGVETEPDDVQSVLAYHLAYNMDRPDSLERIEAEEIIHFKFNSYRNSKRGTPTFIPVISILEGALKTLRNMNQMAQVQAAIAMIRYHDGVAPSNIGTFAERAAAYQQTQPITGQTQNVTRYGPGSILDASGNTRYEFPGGTVNAASFTGVIQAGLRAAASRLNMPEYMFTADASNANYASTMVAEAPSTRNFQRLQKWFTSRFGFGSYGTRRFQGVLGRVLLIAAKNGRIPEAVLHKVLLKVTPPSLVVRNQQEEATVRDIEKRNGVLSPQTWCEEAGRDYRQEMANIEQHEEQYGPMLPGLDRNPAGGMGGA